MAGGIRWSDARERAISNPKRKDLRALKREQGEVKAAVPVVGNLSILTTLIAAAQSQGRCHLLCIQKKLKWAAYYAELKKMGDAKAIVLEIMDAAPKEKHYESKLQDDEDAL